MLPCMPATGVRGRPPLETASYVQAEVIELGHAPRCVDDKVGNDLSLSLGIFSVDGQLSAAFFDGGHRGAHANVHPELSGSLDELGYQVRVEALQGALTPVEDRDIRARAGGDVGELKGDVPTSDEGHFLGQLGEIQETCASCQVVLTRDPEGRVARPGGDDHVPA
jgi:hypothetical protein